MLMLETSANVSCYVALTALPIDTHSDACAVPHASSSVMRNWPLIIVTA